MKKRERRYMQSGTISGVLIMKENRLSNNHLMVSMILALMMSILAATSLSVVFAEDGDNKAGNESKAVRTIMIYLDGSILTFE